MHDHINNCSKNTPAEPPDTYRFAAKNYLHTYYIANPLDHYGT